MATLALLAGRIALVLLGVLAAGGVLRCLAALWRAPERLVAWLALALAAPVALLVAGHVRLLVARPALEAGRARYASYGDPRAAETRAAGVRGWLLDCTGRDDQALVGYTADAAGLRRRSLLGPAGENFVAADSTSRDYTIEQLYDAQLQRDARPGELHAVGADLQLTLCRSLTRRAAALLGAAHRDGAVVVQDVRTGALLAYAATGDATAPPLGVKRYALPGSVFKLALSALWWDRHLRDTVMDCPADVRVGNAVIANAGHVAHGRVVVPHEMLVVSCNTAAVPMAQRLRATLGEAAVADAYRRYGFEPYHRSAPSGSDTAFWATSSRAWQARMSPPRARIRLDAETSAEEWGQLAIGQGPVDVTVMHVSRFVQAIGDGGVMRRPTVEAALAGRDPGTRIMAAATARRLQSAMRDVVRRGTARSAGAALHAAGGWSLGGKTGTAQVEGAPDDGWFAGLVFEPEGAPRYGVVVYLAAGGPGGQAPATIAAALTREIAEHPPAVARP